MSESTDLQARYDDREAALQSANNVVDFLQAKIETNNRDYRSIIAARDARVDALEAERARLRDALAECRNHLYDRQDISRVRDLATAALSAPASDWLAKHDAEIQQRLDWWRTEFNRPDDNAEVARIDAVNYGCDSMITKLLDTDSTGMFSDHRANEIRQKLREHPKLKAALDEAGERAIAWATEAGKRREHLATVCNFLHGLQPIDTPMIEADGVQIVAAICSTYEGLRKMLVESEEASTAKDARIAELEKEASEDQAEHDRLMMYVKRFSPTAHSVYEVLDGMKQSIAELTAERDGLAAAMEEVKRLAKVLDDSFDEGNDLGDETLTSVLFSPAMFDDELVQSRLADFRARMKAEGAAEELERLHLDTGAIDWHLKNKLSNRIAELRRGQ